MFVSDRNTPYLAMNFLSVRLNPVSSETRKCLAHGKCSTNVYLVNESGFPDISRAP